MYNQSIFDIFFDAISNEISIENDILQRLNVHNLSFSPLRSIKTLKYINKYKISLFMYSLLCIIFIFLSPLYFLVKLVKNIKLNQKIVTINSNVILLANGKTRYLYNKLNKNEDYTYININQKDKKDVVSIHTFLSISDYFKAYILAVSSIFYILFKLNKKTDILQVYVAFEWFLIFIGLTKIKSNVDTIYFSNHYDRWAVLFDQLFEEKKNNLIQHGILPDSLNLNYRLKNIKTIYAFDSKSRKLFSKMYNSKNIIFRIIDLKIKLNKIKLNKDKKCILIIGQPHSMDREIEIINYIKDRFTIYVKPHPLFESAPYKLIDSINVIEKKDFYPEVDLALCYESTLGLEYEASGMNVIWWKDLNIEEIVSEIIQREIINV
ncbi:MAG TPA: hypothetical protein EYG73_00400 [Arcobacter sp.]|nr:hypothetical protein [Arcobacter sp.]